MSSFFGNNIAQQFNSKIGQTVAFGQQLSQSINHIETKVGAHTVVFKERLAEGATVILLLTFFTIAFLIRAIIVAVELLAENEIFILFILNKN